MVDALNIKSIMYIGFRLAPFILISFFGLSAMFNSDVKGIIFVAMLLLNCFITMSIGAALPEDPFLKEGNQDQICDALSLSKTGPISKLPLNVNIFTFTLAYLAYIIGINNAAKTNIPTLVVFPLFILYQVYWSWKHGCNSIRYSVASLILGGGLGALFSYAIDQTGLVQLQYFNGITKQDVCVRATNAKYRCSTKPNM